MPHQSLDQIRFRWFKNEQLYIVETTCKYYKRSIRFNNLCIQAVVFKHRVHPRDIQVLYRVLMPQPTSKIASSARKSTRFVIFSVNW